MASELQISLTLAGLSRLFGGDLAGVLEASRIADQVGIDQIVLPDHLAIGPHTDRYPYGRFPFTREEPWLEPVTTLAAMAGATQRLRLGTGVLIASLRPALLLAKSLATLDVLSRGRLDLGVGIGWQAEEFAAGGVPFRGRAARMDDTLRACRALWSDAPASFQSDTVGFEDLSCLPRPVQPGGIPIWFGVALTEANLARIVELGSGWMPLGSDLGELRADVARLRAALREAGRDPETLLVRANAPVVGDHAGRPDLERTLAALPELREAGATVAAFALGRFVRSADGVRPFLERLGQARLGC